MLIVAISLMRNDRRPFQRMLPMTQTKESRSVATRTGLVLSTRVSGEEVSEMDKASRFGQMALPTKVNGKTIERTGKANLSISTAMSTEVTGSTIRQTEKAPTIM